MFWPHPPGVQFPFPRAGREGAGPGQPVQLSRAPWAFQRPCGSSVTHQLGLFLGSRTTEPLASSPIPEVEAKVLPCNEVQFTEFLSHGICLWSHI